ncbi:MAG: hypothetical protein JNL11_02955 [Bdellovibrionaceae bacterium]|nr:hypothetical protein [Pseudobdellovibrionaceae bacterium]
MGTVSQKELKKLFKNIDAKLTSSIDVYIIGGASAILGYNVMKETNDIDIDGGIDSEFNRLFSAEAKKLKLDLYLSSKGVFSPPENYRERMRKKTFPKKKLRVWYLDQYDLAISKIDRGIEKDLEDLKRVHAKSPFEVNTLVEIFNNEYIKVSAIGNPREKMMTLLDLVSMLFDETVLDKVKKEIGF